MVVQIKDDDWSEEGMSASSALDLRERCGAHIFNEQHACTQKGGW